MLSSYRDICVKPALRLGIAGFLALAGTVSAAQEHGGGHLDGGSAVSHEDSDNVHPGEDHEGGAGRGLGPRWQGGRDPSERADDDHSDADHDDGHEDSATHEDEPRGPRWMGGRAAGEVPDHAEAEDQEASGERDARAGRPGYLGGRAEETILTGRHSSSLEDRVLRGHGN